jgi:hypothetical protein
MIIGHLQNLLAISTKQETNWEGETTTAGPELLGGKAQFFTLLVYTESNFCQGETAC